MRVTIGKGEKSFYRATWRLIFKKKEVIPTNKLKKEVNPLTRKEG
jgi:hypothetical protein